MKKQLLMIISALVCLCASCDRDSDLWREIDNLKSRVSALETQVNALNGNIEALSALYSGATISNVEEKDGKWIITLTNGEVIELVQGSEAKALLPIIGIDDKGCWQVSYDGGKTFESLNITAKVEDSAPPQFRINDNGYWEISYDGEKWETVKNPAGQPVAAVGAGKVTDKFFETVEVDGDELCIKLLDGTELRIPVLADFLCKIDADSDIQMFDAGQERHFSVEIRGVDNTIVTAPSGWSARLTEAENDKAELIVKAPSTRTLAAETRATANSSQDVAILATSGRYACIAKIKVETTGVSESEPPTVNVVFDESSAGVTSLSFTVTPENADSWYYLYAKAGETEGDVTAETIRSEGLRGTGSTLLLEGLEADTEYEVYVVAIAANGEYSDVAKALGRTTIDTNDYYTAGVEINGVHYGKDSENAKSLEIAEDAVEDVTVPVGSGGIFFIDDNSDSHSFVTTSSQGIVKDVAVIGRYADHKTEFKMGAYWALRNREATVVFKNLKIDMTDIAANYIFNMSGGSDAANNGAKNLIFEDCEIAWSKIFITYYGANVAASIENIIFRNCKMRFEASDGTYRFIVVQTIDEGLSGIKSLVFENNTIYSPLSGTAATPTAFSFFYHDNPTTAKTGSTENLHITFKNNTLVDIISYGTGIGSAYFYLYKVGGVEFSKNLLHSNRTDKYVSVMRVLYDYNTYTPWPAINLYKQDNKVFGTQGWKLYFDGTGTPASYYPAADKTTYPKLAETAFETCDVANGIFKVKAEYSEYGSTIQ